MAEDEKINKIGQIEEKISIEQGDNSAQIFDDENIKQQKNENVDLNDKNAKADNLAEVQIKEEKSDNLKNDNQNSLFDVVVIEKEELKQQTEFDISRGLEVSEEYTEQKYQKVMEYQSPKKRRKSTIINLCLLLINLIFLVTIVKSLIRNVGEKNILDVVSSQGDKMWWLAGGLLIYVLFMLVQTLMYYVLIKDITGKNQIKLAYDVAVVGKYYDNVTPFAAGGQPMQIVRLVKNGVSVGTSTSIPIIKLIINSTISVILTILFFIFGVPKIPMSTPLNDMLLMILIILAVIGLVITIIVVLFTFLMGTGGLVTRSFISGILRIGYKLKLVKNYRETFQKVLNQVAEYKVSFRYIWKSKKTLLKMIVLSLFECLTYAIMPYFVVQAFIGTTTIEPMLMIVICISQYYICAMASSFIPLPGGSGMMEISFIFLFGVIVGDNVVWALLAWRILSYYLIIAHGFVHELVHIVKGFVKNRKLRELK